MVYSESAISETPDTPAFLPKADTPSVYSIIQNADSIMIGVYKKAITVHIGEGRYKNHGNTAAKHYEKEYHAA